MGVRHLPSVSPSEGASAFVEEVFEAVHPSESCLCRVFRSITKVAGMGSGEVYGVMISVRFANWVERGSQ